MLSAVILSGGMSSRMGTEKGLVELGRKPLVSYVAETLSEISDDLILSVGKGKSSSYRKISGVRVRILEDERTGIGPLEGLTLALSQAKGEYVVVSPCDTPFLKAGMCVMVSTWAKGHDGAVPKIGQDFEPLHGVYNRAAALEAFRRALDAGKRKPIDAYPLMDIVSVEEELLRRVDPELDSFWNLNTLDELVLAEKKLDERGT